MQKLEHSHVKKIHLIGICGVGMRGIAKVLCAMNFDVSGSDLNGHHTVIDELVSLGALLFHSHDISNVNNVDIVVVSGAISKDNPEVLAAKAAKIPVIPRAQMLAELMRFYYGIAVSGTHGKTTTTSMIAHVFAHNNKEPTYVIGGHIHSMTGASLGKGPFMIAEADESDASFLYLKPMIAVITNIDSDHLETYSNKLSELIKAFSQFVNQIPFYGLVALCADDPLLQESRFTITRPYVTYGLSLAADYKITNFEPHEGGSIFKITHHNKTFPVKLKVPGVHNALNAAASLAVANHCGIDTEDAIQSLSHFQGVKRRFDRKGDYAFINGASISIVDDYAHHPTEVRVTIEAARSIWPKCRIKLVFQPHRYSRVKALWNDFIESLRMADECIILPIYPAGERPLDGIDNETLSHAISAQAISEDVLIDKFETMFEDGDIVLFLGAGNITQLCHTICTRLEKVNETTI
ncbi:MAG TPA: UDP-N-acetylmuramate--L-alanine ligase [Gammaproteobacteria bacterium]|nr:UDP-N-acetylmuramate--L-alanine ligase [Gammaproteobacteria bacterium]